MIVRNTMIWDGDEYAIEGDGTPGHRAHRERLRGWDGVPRHLRERRPLHHPEHHRDRQPVGGLRARLGRHVGEQQHLDQPQRELGSKPARGRTAASTYVTPNVNLHLTRGRSAINTGLEPRGELLPDIDGQSRPAGAAWDRGADELGATTEVELLSFEARALDSAVELAWQTASELQQPGLPPLPVASPRRGRSSGSRSSLIPGLGSSPTGASYAYRDGGLLNGQTTTTSWKTWRRRDGRSGTDRCRRCPRRPVETRQLR